MLGLLTNPENVKLKNQMFSTTSLGTLLVWARSMPFCTITTQNMPKSNNIDQNARNTSRNALDTRQIARNTRHLVLAPDFDIMYQEHLNGVYVLTFFFLRKDELAKQNRSHARKHCQASRSISVHTLHSTQRCNHFATTAASAASAASSNAIAEVHWHARVPNQASEEGW